jgi:hypothetical protein
VPIQLIGDNPTPSDDKAIRTRSGWIIPQSPGESELSVETMEGWAKYFLKKFPIKLRSLSRYPYNCVGMVFTSRRAWIDIEHIDQILKTDGYRQIQRNGVLIGDVVVYKFNNKAAHVGSICTTQLIGNTLNIDVLSKWGDGPEFIHPIDRIPELYGVASEFYTDRVGHETEFSV